MDRLFSYFSDTTPARIRNRLKINATVKERAGIAGVPGRIRTRDAYHWTLVNGKPLQPDWQCKDDLRADGL
jgi:3-methyladenine DNA glycosylase Tag